MNKTIVTGIIGNYYGVVKLIQTKEGTYYLTLGDFEGTNKVEISAELAKALIAEFKEN